ncbi:metallophosphoesterase [Variovorax ginsengisoli]|uniref:Metallophosphoesterase n=1 Tax=Variovorax ginsengisoli TaxID=363844 RepID=A0ABT8RYE8_9BURK|nr:metallophosphoesterase [Variovorax ginsengisoli]MDN8612405.1 metallophosphoesterase [Variovorax ginsengisoli]MDO1531575.1 metallophosphoesterase [Variovorax ginsengisoli]
MKILILSDLHLEFAPFETPPALEFDVVILAGDIHSPSRRAVQWAESRFAGMPVIYVPGNHEFYDSRMDLALSEARAAADGGQVRLLDGDELVIDGVRFLGATLWTDFELAIDTPRGRRSDAFVSMKKATNLMNDYALIRAVDELAERDTWRARHGRRLTAEDTRQIHLKQRTWLSQKLSEPFDGPTVVVTHHAPHRGSLAQRYAQDWVSGAFVNELPESFFDVPVLWVHGHTHESFDYRVRSCRIVSNPRGYVNWSGRAENAKFDPGLVIAVQRTSEGNGP